MRKALLEPQKAVLIGALISCTLRSLPVISPEDALVPTFLSSLSNPSYHFYALKFLISFHRIFNPYLSSSFKCRNVSPVNMVILLCHWLPCIYWAMFYFTKHIIHLTFILDDGSSLCCCWTSAERAAKLLRLNEKIPIKAFSSSSWGMKIDSSIKAQSTARYHLEKILKKHHKVTLSSYGDILDSSSQVTFTLYSENRLSCSDESILKCIALNASCGSVIVSSYIPCSNARTLAVTYK